MNIYDRDDGFRKFTLAEANAILPEVIRSTERAAKLLQEVKQTFDSQKDASPDAAQAEFDSRCEYILETWSREIMELGAYPKGFFTVDFKSPVPDTLFCWTLGEQSITHTHKVFESFKDRIPIKDISSIGFDDTLN